MIIRMIHMVHVHSHCCMLFHTTTTNIILGTGSHVSHTHNMYITANMSGIYIEKKLTNFFIQKSFVCVMTLIVMGGGGDLGFAILWRKGSPRLCQSKFQILVIKNLKWLK